jgi:hypothetical protein
MKDQKVDLEETIRKQHLLERRNFREARRQNINSWGFNGENFHRSDIKSIFYDPLMLDTNRYGHVRTISPYYGRPISYRILREVSKKAWILNVCIMNVIRKVRPYLKLSTSENMRGFRIKKKETEEMNEKETAIAKKLAQFMMKTGDVDDPYRKDDLDKYTTKILRDLFQLDQIATELQRTKIGDLCAFWAMDAATIEAALPNDYGIDYLQVIYNVPYGDFSKDEMIFDCMNPRTDIEKAGYGYSLVEQAIDLVTSAINTFMFNAGFFTENKLPRGIILLQGDADSDEVEMIEEYIINLLSGPPTSQWRIPIIPAGKPDGGAEGGQRRLEWVSLQGNNREMEFGEWYDLQLSGIVSLFGESMESIGLHSQKSQPLIGVDTQPKVDATKSLILGDVLGWLQKHFNQIIEAKNPEYELEIVGYERDDPKLAIDIDKAEVGTWKTIDEKRIEKGEKPFKKSWSEIPLNPYVIQLLGQEQSGMLGGGGMGGPDDMEGMDFGDGEAPEGETGEAGEDDSSGTGWDELEVQQEGGQVEKSMSRKDVVRIIV